MEQKLLQIDVTESSDEGDLHNRAQLELTPGPNRDNGPPEWTDSDESSIDAGDNE